MLKLAGHRPAKKKRHCAGLYGAIQHISLWYACDWWACADISLYRKMLIAKVPLTYWNPAPLLEQSWPWSCFNEKTHLCLLLDTQALSLTACNISVILFVCRMTQLQNKKITKKLTIIVVRIMQDTKLLVKALLLDLWTSCENLWGCPTSGFDCSVALPENKS